MVVQYAVPSQTLVTTIIAASVKIPPSTVPEALVAGIDHAVPLASSQAAASSRFSAMDPAANVPYSAAVTLVPAASRPSNARVQSLPSSGADRMLAAVLSFAMSLTSVVGTPTAGDTSPTSSSNAANGDVPAQPSPTAAPAAAAIHRVVSPRRRARDTTTRHGASDPGWAKDGSRARRRLSTGAKTGRRRPGRRAEAGDAEETGISDGIARGLGVPAGRHVETFLSP